MQRKSLKIAFVLMLLAHLASAAVDYLLPISAEQFASYRAVLSQKLAVRRFDCGRLVIKPSLGQPEEAVSVYSVKRNDGDQTYRVAYAQASGSLWEATDGGRRPAREKQIFVNRSEVELDGKTAELIKRVWIRMLTGPRAPRQWEVAPEFIYQDPTVAEFAIELSPENIARGEVPIVDDLGPRTRLFVQLGQTLVSYAKAPRQRREQTANVLRARAERLLHILK